MYMRVWVCMYRHVYIGICRYFIFVPLRQPGWQHQGNDGLYTTCLQVYTYIYLYIPVYKYIYMHIPTYTCTYMHIHAHTCSTWEHQNTQNMLLISARAGASCTMQSVGRMTQVWACLDDPGRFYDRGNMEPNTKSLVRGRFWRLLQP
jgi:hypothetical protein